MGFTVPYSVVDSGTIVTNAAAGVTTTTTLLPAPGVGFRYRIIGISVSPNRTATGAFNMVFLGVFSIWRVNGYGPPPTTPAIIMFPFPGIACDDNAALQVQHNSNIASQQFFVQVYYVIDDVS